MNLHSKSSENNSPVKEFQTKGEPDSEPDATKVPSGLMQDLTMIDLFFAPKNLNQILGSFLLSISYSSTQTQLSLE